MKSVTMKWAAENVAEIDLIDVRTPAEFQVKHVEGSKNIPLVQIIAQADEILDKNKEYHIMCHSGGRSSNAVSQLSDKGFKVINVEGGISSL